MAAQREAPAPYDEHEEDQQERDRALDPGEPALDAEEILDVEAVADDGRLADPDDEPAHQRERERPEPTEERGGHGGDGHDQREGQRRRDR